MGLIVALFAAVAALALMGWVNSYMVEIEPGVASVGLVLACLIVLGFMVLVIGVVG